MRRLLVYRFPSSIFRLAVPILLALACSGISFCGEIHEAAKAGDLEKVKAVLKPNPELVSSRDSEGETPLHLAANYGHEDVVQFLLTHKAEVNAKTNDGWTPLHSVGLGGSKAVAQLLLTYKADVNARTNDGDTPLFEAATPRGKDVAELLLANNADANAKNKDGRTALHEATYGGYKEVAELLLQKGADVNAADSRGMTPLLDVVIKGDKETAEFLLAHKADVNAREKLGHTSLFFAAGTGNKDMALLLLTHGADVNATNKLGQTALDAARIHKHQDIMELLQARGAKAGSEVVAAKSPGSDTDQDLIRQLSGGVAKARAPRKVDPYDHNQSTERVSANTKGTVYFFRAHQMVGAPLKPPISCDGAELAHMQNGRYFPVQIEPGRHSFYSKDSRTDLVVAPGGIYYFETKVEPFTDKF